MEPTGEVSSIEQKIYIMPFRCLILHQLAPFEWKFLKTHHMIIRWLKIKNAPKEELSESDRSVTETVHIRVCR